MFVKSTHYLYRIFLLLCITLWIVFVLTYPVCRCVFVYIFGSGWLTLSVGSDGVCVCVYLLSSFGYLQWNVAYNSSQDLQLYHVHKFWTYWVAVGKTGAHPEYILFVDSMQEADSIKNLFTIFKLDLATLILSLISSFIKTLPVYKIYNYAANIQLIEECPPQSLTQMKKNC